MNDEVYSTGSKTSKKIYYHSRKMDWNLKICFISSSPLKVIYYIE